MPEPTEQDNYLAQRLLEVIDTQNADGAHKFSDEEVRHILPLLLLRAGLGLGDDDQLSDKTLELVGQFASKAGVTPSTTEAEVGPLIEAYYAENPPNAELFDALTKLFEELTAESGGGDLSKAVKTLLGNESSNRPVGGAAPDGAFKGGLLGRLAAQDFDKDKK